MPPDPPRRHVQNGLTNQNWLAPGLMPVVSKIVHLPITLGATENVKESCGTTAMERMYIGKKRMQVSGCTLRTSEEDYR